MIRKQKEIVVALCILTFLLLNGCSLFRGAKIVNSHEFTTAKQSSYKPGDVTVRFFGISTLLFSDGETHILVDGFFSRSSFQDVLFNKRGYSDPI